MTKINNLPWYQGAISFWFKEAGCTSYCVIAIISALFSFAAINIVELLELMAMFSIVSMYCAIAWQSIRLQATEWQDLVQGYRQHVMFQAKIFLGLINAIVLLSVIASKEFSILATMGIANVLGIIVWFINRSSSHLFSTICYVIFFISALICGLTDQLPVWLIPVNIIAFIAIALLYNNFSSAYVWRPDALINYRNGLQSGWSPIPSGFLSNYGSPINKGLFPLSYFVGSGLSQYLILLTLLCIIGVAINLFHNITEHVIFVLTLTLFAIVTLSLWSKVQKQNSWELLFTLPIYNTSYSAKIALSHSVLKLAALVALLCFSTAAALTVANKELLLVNALSYSLACAAGLLLSFAIGNICKNINLLSVLLCLSFGLNMGLATYMFDHGDSLSKLTMMGIYTFVMAAINRLTVRYL